MKYFLFISFTFFCIFCNAQKKEQIKFLTAKMIEKEFVKIADSLYACRTETSNFEYTRFLNAIARHDSVLYKQYSVDSFLWLEKNQPMAEYYHKHSGFAEYPAVAMSFESALAYCAWLTEQYNTDPQRKFRSVIFILPTEAAWEQAASGTEKNAIFPWGTRSMRDTRKGSWQGMFLANYRHVGDPTLVSDDQGKPIFDKKKESEIEVLASGINDRAFYTAPVKSFFPNSFGIYNQGGNVAEMTNQKGLTKGGSWNSLGGELKISYQLFFYEPSIEVGFRVFMKIIEQ